MNLGRLEGEQSRLDFDLCHIEKDCKWSAFKDGGRRDEQSQKPSPRYVAVRLTELKKLRAVKALQDAL